MNKISTELLKKNEITFLSPEIKKHNKATEKYVDVEFELPFGRWSGWIPIEYRRTGTHLTNEKDIIQHVINIYSKMAETTPTEWLDNEQTFWSQEKSRATETKSFFDVLAKGGWKCRACTLPNNPNWARRIQDLKEFGYTLATDTKRYCNTCDKNSTHLILLPIPRIQIAGNGYETWSLSLRKRIMGVLDNYDVYEGKRGTSLLPDHKFSEIRWDEGTKAENPDEMTDEEIREKFQLMSNQRNQQKREACRTCFQTQKRQYPFGINFFYSGNENWSKSIPAKGVQAKNGCHGCAWYDMEKWRIELLKKLNPN